MCEGTGASIGPCMESVCAPRFLSQDFCKTEVVTSDVMSWGALSLGGLRVLMLREWILYFYVNIYLFT